MSSYIDRYIIIATKKRITRRVYLLYVYTHTHESIHIYVIYYIVRERSRVRVLYIYIDKNHTGRYKNTCTYIPIPDNISELRRCRKSFLSFLHISRVLYTRRICVRSTQAFIFLVFVFLHTHVCIFVL